MKHYIMLLQLVVVFLGACASNKAMENTQYYHLPNSDFIPPLQLVNVIEVAVDIADYLSSSSMAIGDHNTGSVVLTNNHLWTGNLTRAVQNNLSNKLNRLGKADNLYFSIYSSQGKKLRVVIEKFQGNLNGKVEIAGHVNLLDNSGRIKNSMAFREVEQQNNVGYQAMVETMDRVLTKVAKTVYTLF